MEHDAEGAPGGNGVEAFGTRTVLGRLLALTGLAGTLAVVEALGTPGGAGAVVRGALETLYLWMPVVAGILVGRSSRPRATRSESAGSWLQASTPPGR